MKQAKPNSQPRHIKWIFRSVDALKPEPARYIAWAKDGDGRGVRVTPKGAKSFILAYRFEGQPRMLTLYGRYPKLSLASAGRLYADARKLLEKGEDPGVKVVAEKRTEREAATVTALARQYIEHIKSPKNPKKSEAPRKRSWREDERIIEKDLIPALGRRKARDVSRADLRTLIRDINETRRAPIMANRTLACVRGMFNWAVSEDLLPASPAVAIPAPGDEALRDRTLSEDEIHDFWTRLEDTDMKEGTRIALKLILATGQRPGEIVGAEWAELDLPHGWWEIPGERTKNGRTHRVPLHSVSIQLIKRLEPTDGTERWLFPAAKGKHLRADALPKAVSNNRAAFDLEHFRPHDLRRTVVTQMKALKTPLDTVSKIMNHTEQGVTAKHYDRYDYADEKFKAMRKWGHKLDHIITGKKTTDKVVRIA